MNWFEIGSIDFYQLGAMKANSSYILILSYL